MNRSMMEWAERNFSALKSQGVENVDMAQSHKHTLNTKMVNCSKNTTLIRNSSVHQRQNKTRQVERIMFEISNNKVA